MLYERDAMEEHSENQFAACIRDRLVKQLVSVNEQLEQFAYVASHDLREPLRVIVCFTDLLAKEYADKMDDTGRRYMDITRNAAKKMEAMVANILEYGKLGHNTERLAPTNCENVLKQALESLAESIKSTDAKITNSPLPIIMAPPHYLLSLFQNLVGNAIKYRRSDEPPIIYIEAIATNDWWEFSVTDNGIGIEPEYIDTIFQPFKRLHSDEQYSGTGIGLAICKRIIENLGGSIRAKSSPGKGSIFYFTIPKRS